ncbi:MAG TPA: SDR family oxidoreductase [Polyangiaceae bacterium]|nr:SDR family oxidoreductase [Polyangiaceae bacterium]
MTQRIALITGGSRGLGRSMALQLAARNIDVILTYRSNAKEANQVVAGIAQLGRKAVALPLDVARSATFPAFADTVRSVLADRWNRATFDCLVNNAGTGAFAPFLETTEEQFDQLLDSHLRGTFFLSQKLIPLIADGGRILNVSSGLTRYTYPGQAAYAAMKAGVEVLTRYMALELGPRISVNVIAPGGVETDFAGGAMRDPNLQKVVAAETALARVAKPDDIGGVVAALLAPETAWLNGQRIEVTGGFRL